MDHARIGSSATALLVYFFPAFLRFAAQYAFILRDVAFLPAADIPPRL